MQKKFILVISLFAVVIGAALLLQRRSSPTQASPSSAAEKVSENGKHAASNEPAAAGSTDERAVATAEAKKAGGAPVETKDDKSKPNQDQNLVAPERVVKGNDNAQVRSVAEALRDKNHPERLSPLIPDAPFNLETYKADPQKYLSTVSPSRAFAPAQPSKDTPKLKMMSPQLQDVAPGDSVTLKVKTLPKMPVNLLSTDLGAFQNKLTAITVEADEEGVAEVRFFATEGTTNTCRIVAASPVASGQVSFYVNVTAAK